MGEHDHVEIEAYMFQAEYNAWNLCSANSTQFLSHWTKLLIYASSSFASWNAPFTFQDKIVSADAKPVALETVEEVKQYCLNRNEVDEDDAALYLNHLAEDQLSEWASHLPSLLCVLITIGFYQGGRWRLMHLYVNICPCSTLL